MNKFLNHVVLILLCTYLCAFAFQSISDQGLKKCNDVYYGEWNSIMNGKINAEIILSGSSRVYVGYNPEIISKITSKETYNLGFNAGAYNLQNMKWKTYLKYNKKPDILVQNIDLTHLISSKEIPELEEYIPYLNEDIIVEEISKLHPEYKWINYFPLLKYNGNLDIFKKGVYSFFGKEYNFIETENGFLAKDLEYKEDTHNLISLSKMINNVNLLSFLEDGLTFTEEFARNPENKDIKIILVWAPEKEERLNLIYPVICNIKDDFQALANSLNNVYFFDFSNDSISYDENYFYDTFHLNKNGAELFSQKLANQINKLSD